MAQKLHHVFDVFMWLRIAMTKNEYRKNKTEFTLRAIRLFASFLQPECRMLAGASAFENIPHI